MFFFFVGGVEQQVGKVVNKGVSRCINCGSKADLVNYDNVLKLFFVPVWRWSGKHPILHCPNCNLFFPQSSSLLPPPPGSADLDLVRCSSCSRLIHPDYRFCPFCSVSL